MALTESRRAANRRWDRDNIRQVSFRFMRKGDADILEWLDHLDEPKIEYIRRLIRADMDKSR